MYNFRKKGFSGYKIRHTYLERVNNYLQGVASNHPTDDNEQKNQNDESEMHSSSTLNQYNHYQPQHSRNAPVNPYASYRSGSNITQVDEQQPQTQQKKVTSSDLRNKKTAIQNNNYHYSHGPQRRGRATYAVRPSYSAGAFQTDGL